MLWVRRTLLFVLLSMLSVMGSRAEDKLAWLPDYFDRVTTLEELVDGAYYLVAGTSQRDGHVMMTGDVVNKKLLGVINEQQNRIYCEDGTYVWQILRAGNEVILRAVLTDKFIYAPQSNKPEVELQAGKYTTWLLQEKGDGFVLKHPSEKSRYLHTSYAANADNPNPFGNYSFSEGTVETNVLYFYKLDAPYSVPTDNTVTYLEEGEKVPAYGNLIVKNGKLCTPSVLLDGMDFEPMQPFTVSEGQLSYTRILEDGNWETLALPFAATVPSEVEARELSRVEQTTLEFTSVSEIRPHVPVIIRCKSKATESVTFVAKAGEVSLPTAKRSTFSPLYQQMAVGDASEGVFLLTAFGKTFVLADRGSTLRPFRAYMQGIEESTTLRVQLKR